MRRVLSILLVLIWLALCWWNPAHAADPSYTHKYQVITSSDDTTAWNATWPASWPNSRTDALNGVSIVFGKTASYFRVAGMRFKARIPAGSTITSATLKLFCSTTASTDAAASETLVGGWDFGVVFVDGPLQLQITNNVVNSATGMVKVYVVR